MQKIAFDIAPSDKPDVTLKHHLDSTDVIVQVYEKVETSLIRKHLQVEILDQHSVRITLRWTPRVFPNPLRVVIIG